MRSIKYTIKKSEKFAQLSVDIEDRFGKSRITLSKVRGWRRELALKNLKFNQNEWNDDTARAYVGMEILKCAKNYEEAIKFLQILKSLSKLELHFWSSKFLSNKKASRAWRALYG